MADSKHDQAPTQSHAQNRDPSGRRCLAGIGRALVLAGRGPGRQGQDRRRAERARSRPAMSPASWRLAADDKGVVLRRRLRQAQPGDRGGDDAGHHVLDRLDDQGGDLDRRHADGRAGQAPASTSPISDVVMELQRRAGAGRLRRRGQAQAAGAQAADHAPAPADPYGGLQLRPVEQGHRALHEGGPRPRHRHLQARGAEGADDRRPRRKWEYGINIDWAGKAVEAGERHVARRLHARPHLHAARHEGYRLHPAARPAGAPGDASMPAAPTASSAPSSSACPRRRNSSWAAAPSTRRDATTSRSCGRCWATASSGTAQILKPETVALVNKNSMGDLNVTLLKTAQPDLTNDAEFFPGMVKKWGWPT